MTYWAIATGINHYLDRRLKPLMYAQRDAQSMYQFLTTTGGFQPHHCLLLSDGSPAFTNELVYPDRSHVQTLLTSLSKQVQAEDFLWFFFSGQGVQVEGKDYLALVDSDSSQIRQTGIAVQDVLEALRSLPTQNLLLILDLNRTQPSGTAPGVGTETIELAHQYDIPTILSCTPQQSSYETLGLRQGVFTAALLEGLRGGCITLEQLAQHLASRVPELCDHHWRPRQDPLVMASSSRRYELILPGKLVADKAETSFGVNSVVAVESFPSAPPLASPTTANLTVPQPGIPRPPERPPETESPTQEAIASLASVPAAAAIDQPTDDLFWHRLRIWSAGIGLLLLVAVLYSLREEIFGNSPETDSTAPPVMAPPAASPAPTGASPNPGMMPTNPAIPITPSAAQSPQPPPVPPSPSPATEADRIFPTSPFIEAVPPSVEPQSGRKPSPVAVSPSPSNSLMSVAVAQSALATQQFETALAHLQKIPVGEHGDRYQNLLQQATQGILGEARATLGKGDKAQASALSLAIQRARRIRAGQPYYGEAQRDIRQWSETILALAQNRAAQANQGSSTITAYHYHSAILAAKLVPVDQSTIYTTAQHSIRQWGQGILAVAQTHANQDKLGLAVQVAQLIPANTPVFPDAQTAIAQWSQRLMTQAQTQANTGQLPSAIQTAQQIPLNTPGYEAAQVAIAQWQDQR